jgi:glycosyltransferase involved in cell wall biosynthesis
MEEIPDDDCQILSHLLREKTPEFSYFVHDFVDSELQALLSERAHKVFANSAELSSLISSRRPDVISVFSPGARVRQKLARPDLRLLTAGMAHKIRSKGYADLARLLDGETRHIRLEITSAIHEGQRFDESFFSVAEDIRRVFRHDIHFCGFLSDEELSQRLHMADAYVAFFPRGVRENNTTVLSAMTHGCPVITNLDAYSPQWMVHGSTLFDVSRLVSFPEKSDLRAVGDAGMRAAERLNFEHLAEILTSRYE